MPLTRSFKGTVQARAGTDPAFREALLRDYISATIGFEALGSATGTPPKSLARMFGPHGNLHARNLFSVLRYLQNQEGVRLRLHPASPPTRRTVRAASEAIQAPQAE